MKVFIASPINEIVTIVVTDVLGKHILSQNIQTDDNQRTTFIIDFQEQLSSGVIL